MNNENKQNERHRAKERGREKHTKKLYANIVTHCNTLKVRLELSSLCEW